MGDTSASFMSRQFREAVSASHALGIGRATSAGCATAHSYHDDVLPVSDDSSRLKKLLSICSNVKVTKDYYMRS